MNMSPFGATRMSLGWFKPIARRLALNPKGTFNRASAGFSTTETRLTAKLEAEGAGRSEGTDVPACARSVGSPIAIGRFTDKYWI
jgi:hypothetical protein